MEYGVLARDRFLNRLPKLRTLGSFKELLEPGGAILYRNLFREEQVREAWDLFTALQPWHDRLVCYLSGEEVPVKTASDVLWCAAFLRRESPCRGPAQKKERPVGCAGARILLGTGSWELEEDGRRHALTFSRVDPEGVLRFDREAIAEFLRRSPLQRQCPAAPARDAEACAGAFEELPVRALGWPLAAELSPQLRARLGGQVLKAEHAFVLTKGHPDLPTHASLELVAQEGEFIVRLAGSSGPSIASELLLPAKVREVLGEGILLRAQRVQEAYARRAGGHYELEQRFVLAPRFQLVATDRAHRLRGYTFKTYPRATPGYAAWVERVVEALP